MQRVKKTINSSYFLFSYRFKKFVTFSASNNLFITYKLRKHTTKHTRKAISRVKSTYFSFFSWHQWSQNTNFVEISPYFLLGCSSWRHIPTEWKSHKCRFLIRAHEICCLTSVHLLFFISFHHFKSTEMITETFLLPSMWKHEIMPPRLHMHMIAAFHSISRAKFSESFGKKTFCFHFCH